MKLFTVKKCKEILKEKYNITKGISKHTKKQLNELLFSCNNNKIIFIFTDPILYFSIYLIN